MTILNLYGSVISVCSLRGKGVDMQIPISPENYPIFNSLASPTRLQILNLLAVWALTGLWHGASWNFVLWGLYFFVLLSIEKQIAPKLETLPFIVRNLVTMFFVLIGWVLFMNTSLSGIGSAFTAMFGGGTSFAGSGVSLQLKNSLPLLLTCLIGSSVLPRWAEFRKNPSLTP